MSDHAHSKPSWLRWQPIRFSPWLILYVIGTGLPPLLVPIFLEWKRQGEGFWRVYETWGQHMTTQPPSVFIVLYSLIATGILVWLTYFSRSQRVKDHDRFAVLLMLCGASLGWIVMIVRILARS
jgi:hypothetical protein